MALTQFEQSRRSVDMGALEGPVEELFSLLPDEHVRAALVTWFRPLAIHLAKRYAGRGQEREDLEQVACVGLINAIDRFDPAYGSRFISFAVPTITGEIKRHFRDTGWGAGVPRRLKDVSIVSRKASDELTQQMGRSPTVDEIADYTGESVERVAEAAALGNAYRPETLDALRRRRGAAIIDTLGSDDRRLDLFDDLDALSGLFGRQSKRDQEILYLRFCDELTQLEIARRVGLSQMHVSRILTACLAEMRVLMPV